jgi:hypothetical protein
LTDYFGFNHWRSPYSVGSCEKLRNSVVTPGTWVSSAYWSHSWTKDGSNIDMIKVRLHAGYIDGHVSSYTSSEIVPMQVSFTSDGSTPYPDGVGMGPGTFYLPEEGLR